MEDSYLQLKSKQIGVYSRINESDRDTTLIDVQKVVRKYQRTIYEFTTPYVCAQCGVNYTREMNLQYRSCSNHISRTLLWDKTGQYRVFKCCGQDVNSLGCRPSMHYASEEGIKVVRDNPTTEKITIPAILIDLDILKCDKRMIDNYDVAVQDIDRKEYHIKCIGFQFEDFFS